MNGLAPSERDRLIKLLNLLASNHAGERDAAGLAAARLLRQRDLSWDEVVASPEAPRSRLTQFPAGWRETVRLCFRRPSALTQWEQDFCGNLLTRTSVSEKQQAVLDRIFARLSREAR